MKLRRLFRSVSVVAAVGLLTALAAASAQAAPFAGKPSLVEVDAYCDTTGKDRGTVYVEIAARYPDAPKANGVARHEVRSQAQVIDAMGSIVATDSDGGRAQVDIPGLSSYVHTHQHKLSKAESRRVLGGKQCGRATAAPIRVKAKLGQSLVKRGGAKASASATEAQSSGAAGAATVTGVAAAPPTTNGCVYDSLGLMDCYGAMLAKANFTGLYIAYANFAFADLSGAEFRETRMGHAEMNRAKLDGANLSGAELGVATLTSASLVGTNFSGAKAPYANLAVAKFSGADLSGAIFTGANLAETKFEGANKCDAQTVVPALFGFGCVNGVIAKR